MSYNDEIKKFVIQASEKLDSEGSNVIYIIPKNPQVYHISVNNKTPCSKIRVPYHWINISSFEKENILLERYTHCEHTFCRKCVVFLGHKANISIDFHIYENIRREFNVVFTCREKVTEIIVDKHNSYYLESKVKIEKISKFCENPLYNHDTFQCKDHCQIWNKIDDYVSPDVSNIIREFLM